MSKRSVLFNLPLGNVGNGPFSVWVRADNGDLAPEAVGYDNEEAAFAHIAELRADWNKKIDAVRVLTEGQLPEEVVASLRDATEPEWIVYRMVEVPRVDVSRLPKINPA